MSVRRESGQSIQGHKIIWLFGGYTTGASKGTRFEGSFSKNGKARVTRRLTGPSRTGKPLQSATLECESARWAADKQIKVDSKKVTSGNHRCFSGVIKGDAVCTVVVPLRSQR